MTFYSGKHKSQKINDRKDLGSSSAIVSAESPGINSSIKKVHNPFIFLFMFFRKTLCLSCSSLHLLVTKYLICYSRTSFTPWSLEQLMLSAGFARPSDKFFRICLAMKLVTITV